MMQGWHGTLALTGAAMTAFAANSLLCRAALGTSSIDAVTFTAVRVVSGAAALYVVRRSRQGAVGGSWASALALYVYAFAFSVAYTRIPTGVGALLLFASVQVTMIGYELARGMSLHRGEWLGLGVAVCGLVVLTRPGLEAPDPTGAALMALAGASWGGYTLRGRHRAHDPLSATAGNFAYASIPALAMSLATATAAPPHWSPGGVMLAIASGAIASGLGYVVWYAALEGLTSSTAAIVQLSAPVLAALGGVLLLGEAFTLRLALAMPLVLGGIALAIWARWQV